MARRAVGLVRADGTPEAGLRRLHGLVKGDWWLPPTTLRTDDAGRVRVGGFLGDYDVTWRGRSARFSLEEPGSVEVTARLDTARS